MRTREEKALRFVAGMFGVQQSLQTGALSPAFGWAIVHDGEEARAQRLGRTKVKKEALWFQELLAEMGEEDPL